MQSTLTTSKTTSEPTARSSDDPHDIVVVAPDAVRVAPSEVAPVDAELSDLLHQAAARHRSETPARTAPDFAVSPPVPTVSTVPTVDTTFRSAAANAGPVRDQRGSMVRRTMRAFMTLLLAGCIGVAAFAWRAQGAATKQMIAQWTPQFVQTLFPSDQPGLAVPPAAPAVVQADAVSAAPPPVQTAPEAVAPAAAASPESSPLLQSMARAISPAWGRRSSNSRPASSNSRPASHQRPARLAKLPTRFPSKTCGPKYQRFRRGRPPRTSRCRHFRSRKPRSRARCRHPPRLITCRGKLDPRRNRKPSRNLKPNHKSPNSSSPIRSWPRCRGRRCLCARSFPRALYVCG